MITDYIVGPYSGQYILIGVLNKVVHYNSYYYFFTSILLRACVSISLYLLTKYITTNKVLAFIAGVLFSIQYAGIQTTEAVVNSSNYVSLFFWIISFQFLLRYYFDSKRYYLNFFYFLLFASISLIVATSRANGIIFVFFILEFIFLIFKKTTYKLSALRLFFFFTLLYLIKIIGFFKPVGSANVNPLLSMEKSINSLFAAKLWLSYFVKNIVEIIVPPRYSSAVNIWVFCVLISLILFYTYVRSNEKYRIVLLVSISWFFAFMLAPYTYYPNSYNEVTSRYLLFPSIGILIIISLFLETLFKEKLLFYKISAVSICALLLIINTVSINNFISDVSVYRNNEKIEAIFKVMNAEVSKSIGTKRPLIYIQSDDSTFVYFAVLYGGQERFSLRNQYFDTAYFPFIITDRLSIPDEIIKNNISVNDFYSFNIVSGNAISSTVEERKKYFYETTRLH